MNSISWLGLLLRWLHIVAAMTAVGGMIYMRFALVPSVSVLSDEQRQTLEQQLRSRWAKIVAAAIAFLLISGIWNYIRFLSESKTWGDDWRNTYNGFYQAAFGVKFLLALVIFFLSSALAGRTEGTKKFRENAKYWMTVNLVLALIVVALSNVLRNTHTGPTGVELKQPVSSEDIVSR
jgi:uncharacterized membrane protein